MSRLAAPNEGSPTAVIRAKKADRYLLPLP